VFFLGFSSVFINKGVTEMLIYDVFMMYQDIIEQIDAIFIIFVGFGIVNDFNFKFLMNNKQLHFKNSPTGFIGSFFIGMAFSMGWTSCMGPILAVVLSLAAAQPDKGMILMISYILGFAIPFLTLSFFVGRLNWIKKHSAKLVKVGGYI